MKHLHLSLWLVAILFGTTFFAACKEPDIRLVNRVKTFDPKWADLGDKLSYLDRNLDIAEENYEKDFAEIKGLLGEIPDSLRNSTFRRNVAQYDSLIITRDTLRAMQTKYKAAYVTEVETFNEWEGQVMSGDIPYEEGRKTLNAYKLSHKKIDHTTDSLTSELRETFEEHNLILRDLAKRMDIFQDFNLKMQ